ncbi:MAG: aldo/keto reductase [Pseudomonadota bacterium]
MTTDSIRGRATQEGTSRFAARHTENLSEHYRMAGGLSLSDLGIGSYIGRWDDETDQRYTNSVVRAVERGVNVIDTAINYRFQRSERAIGEALAELITSGKIGREEIVVATKGGFLPFENEPPQNPLDWMDANLFEPGIIAPSDIVAECHCIEPTYLRHQIGQSLKNLGLETIDIYYLHNVEIQLSEISESELDDRIRGAFEALEDEVDEGRIARYGVATWDGFRMAPGEPRHHSLSHFLELAHSVAGEKHHFKAVQLPFNFMLREAATRPTQEWRGDLVTFLRLAHELGFMVMTSVPLLQGKLLGRLPPALAPLFADATNDPQRAIAFSAGAPGVSTALVGMSRTAHVDQNTEYLRRRRLDPVSWRKVVDAVA